MLTPVVSEKKKKKQKCGSGRSVAKELILRRDTELAVIAKKDIAPAAGVKPVAAASSVASASGAENTPQFTDADLNALDALYDIVSWLVYLFSGNYEKMNESAVAIAFRPLTAEEAATVKAKLRDKIVELANSIDKAIETDKPIAATVVSDIRNQIEAQL